MGMVEISGDRRRSLDFGTLEVLDDRRQHPQRFARTGHRANNQLNPAHSGQYHSSPAGRWTKIEVATRPTDPGESVELLTCPECGGFVRRDWDNCRNCGHELSEVV